MIISCECFIFYIKHSTCLNKIIDITIKNEYSQKRDFIKIKNDIDND